MARLVLPAAPFHVMARASAMLAGEMKTFLSESDRASRANRLNPSFVTPGVTEVEPGVPDAGL